MEQKSLQQLIVIIKKENADLKKGWNPANTLWNVLKYINMGNGDLGHNARDHVSEAGLSRHSKKGVYKMIFLAV